MAMAGRGRGRPLPHRAMSDTYEAKAAVLAVKEKYLPFGVCDDDISTSEESSPAATFRRRWPCWRDWA